MEKLVARILEGDKRSAAKAITMIENNEIPKKSKLLNLIYPHTGHARVVGITGPPGAGKSTLVDGLIHVIRKLGLTVGVVAIDPSSPYTGGAILGDRIRMQKHATDPGVFIRSMGNRGTLGGLSKATKEAVNVLDAMGLNVILIETVGVGQSELEIINIAETTIVVLHPSTGDSIQASKAGIMEIADLFIVNKSDLPGSQKLIYELEVLLSTSKRKGTWIPPIVVTIGTEKKGLVELWEKINEHMAYLKQSGVINITKEKNLEKELLNSFYDLVQIKYDQFITTNEFKNMKASIIKNKLTPLEAAKIIYDDVFSAKKK